MPSIKELFPSRWLGASDLQGQDYTLVVRRVTIEELKQGSKTDATAKPVVWFNDVQKGMVLNKTNAVVIARLYGDDTDGWAGKPVTLYPARERAFGQDWDVIRVRPSKPAMPASAPHVATTPAEPVDDIDALDRNGIVRLWGEQNKTFATLPTEYTIGVAWQLDIPHGVYPAEVKAMLRERTETLDNLLDEDAANDPEYREAVV